MRRLRDRYRVRLGLWQKDSQAFLDLKLCISAPDPMQDASQQDGVVGPQNSLAMGQPAVFSLCRNSPHLRCNQPETWYMRPVPGGQPAEPHEPRTAILGTDSVGFTF